MQYVIEKITGDNRRPGMPQEGYLVRHGLDERFGWTRMKCFTTESEAQEFASSLNAPLVASAPELLELCKEVETQSRKRLPIKKDTWLKLCAAIAKAEGRN